MDCRVAGPRGSVAVPSDVKFENSAPLSVNTLRFATSFLKSSKSLDNRLISLFFSRYYFLLFVCYWRIS